MSTSIDTSKLEDFVDQTVQESGVVDRLRSGAMVAEVGAGTLEDAGFSRVRVVAATPFDAVLEARP